MYQLTFNVEYRHYSTVLERAKNKQIRQNVNQSKLGRSTPTQTALHL